MNLNKPLRLAALAGIVVLTAASDGLAAERHYVLIFGSQSQPKLLKYTHTWATFVRAIGDDTDPARQAIYAHTISWLPQTLDVRVWRPRPELGINLTLEQTLRTVYESNQHVMMWGPFFITPELYARSLAIYGILNSGAVQYRAISTSANLLVSDCIHAVAAVDPIFGRGHYPLVRVGHPASRFIAREIMVRSLENRGINQASFDNSWLIPRLGLNRYPIQFVSPQQIPPSRCFFCRMPD